MPSRSESLVEVPAMALFSACQRWLDAREKRIEKMSVEAADLYAAGLRGRRRFLGLLRPLNEAEITERRAERYKLERGENEWMAGFYAELVTEARNAASMAWWAQKGGKVTVSGKVVETLGSHLTTAIRRDAIRPALETLS